MPPIIHQRNPFYLPFVDYNDSQTWNGPLVAANFRMLVDLSNVVNWRHTGTNYLILHRSFTVAVKSAAGASWSIAVGVVLAVSPASCTVAYLEPMSIGIEPDDNLRVVEERYFQDFPVSLKPTAPAGGLAFGVVASNIVVEAAITNATPIVNAAGVAAVAPAVGDLVMKVLKTSAAPGPTLRVRQFFQYIGA